MAEIVNDRDVLIMAAVPRYTPPTDRGMFLTPPAAIFRVSGDGSTPTPPSFTFKATLLNMAGQVSFAASNGAKLTVNPAKNEATLDYAAYLAAGAEAVFITAAITVHGEPYTQQAVVTKVADGAQGADGAQTGVARLYQFSTTVPTKPTGGSTFTWAGAWNGGYTGTDGWSVTAPANPGTPGLRLYVASVSVSAPAKATTTTVSYTGATVEAWSQNGAKGDTGTSGVQSGVATVYQWAATIPSGPAGNALFRWASSAFGEAPAGWALTPGAAPSLGMTLWAASVKLVDTAANGDTAFNWSAASIMAIGYAGTNGEPGQPGGPGEQGASYVTAYIASSAIAANGVPAQTTGRASLPAANSSGLAGAWSAAVPTLADGQRMYQSDGIYDPATDKVTWSIPYWSSLKVATLSAITANLGNITGGSLNIGNGKFTVDAAGNVTMSSFILFDPNTGKAMLQAGGVINPDFLPAGVKNSEIQVGGTNLAQDSAFDGRLRPWTQRSGATAGVVIEGAAGARNLLFDTNGGDAYVDGLGPGIPVTPGQQYVFSFEYATATNGQITSSSVHFYQNSGGTVYLPFAPLNSGGVRTRWTSAVWTCPPNVTSLTPRFGINSTGYSWMRVYNFDVQKGNKAAAWSPAPEDVRADTQAKAEAARVAAVNAAAADATAKANVAATTSTWAGTTGPGKPQDNATVGADSSNLKTGTGRPNLLEQNTLPVNLTMFSTYFQVAGMGPFIARGSDSFAVYSKDRRGCIWINATGTPAAGTVIDIYRSDRVKIIPGQRYEFGVTLSTHRTTSRIAVAWYHADGNYITENGGNDVTNSFWDTNSNVLPTRSVLIVTPPAEARSAMVFVRQVHNGGDNPYTFASQWYAAEALPGQTEPSPYSASPLEARDLAESAQAGLTDKLSQTAGGVMQGQVTLQTSGAIVAGNASYSSAGYGGTGTVMSPYGIACVQNGVPKFAVSSSGNVYFAGELAGAYGTFGTLRINSGGYVVFGSFNGWDWPMQNADGSYPAGGVMYGAGIRLGNARDPNRGYFEVLADSGELHMPGFNYSGRQLTLDNPIIIAPRLQTTLSVSLPFRPATNQVNGSTFTFGVSPVITGGVGGPYRYVWSFAESRVGSGSMSLTSSLSASSAAIRVGGSNTWVYGSLSLTVYDAGGASASTAVDLSVQFGQAQQM